MVGNGLLQEPSPAPSPSRNRKYCPPPPLQALNLPFILLDGTNERQL